jgi:hypothetical protein
MVADIIGIFTDAFTVWGLVFAGVALVLGIVQRFVKA